MVKIIAKKFGGKEKISTFAIPNENGVHEHSKFGKPSSLKRLITVQEASTEKNTIYREALISFEIISVRDKLRII